MTGFCYISESKITDGHETVQQFTDTRSMAMFLKDIAKSKPLTRAEEGILADLAHKGNRAARDRLATANMRFVLAVALTYKGSPLEVCDLVNEGVVGLHKAIDKFDPKTGMRFISYAVWWVRSYMGKAINEYGYGSIRLPANKYKKLHDSIKTGDTSKLTDQELKMLPMMLPSAKIDGTVDDDSDTLLAEIIGDPKSMDGFKEIEDKERSELLRGLLDTLPETSRKSLEQHFFDNCSLEELQCDLKISRERIRQIKNRTIERIRASRTSTGTHAATLLRELCA